MQPADALPRVRRRSSSLDRDAPCLLHPLGVPPCPPPPTPTARLLPLKDSWTLGVAKPWSLAWAARQPRVSRVAQRRTPTTGMVGTRLGSEVEGTPGRGGWGGRACQRGHRGEGCQFAAPATPPGGGTSPTSPHPTLHHPLARSILRGGLGASPGRRGGPSAKPCSAGWEGGGQESGGAQPHLLGCQAKQTGRGEHGGEHRCSTLLHPSRRALPR